MFFWLLISSLALLSPSFMIVFGIIFLISAPKGINYVFGYRTRRSMKTHETWKFAHRLLGILWLALGVLSFSLILAPMVLLFNAPDSTIGTVGALLTLVGLVVLAIPILPVEIALNKKFDVFGHRIKK